MGDQSLDLLLPPLRQWRDEPITATTGRGFADYLFLPRPDEPCDEQRRQPRPANAGQRGSRRLPRIAHADGRLRLVVIVFALFALAAGPGITRPADPVTRSDLDPFRCSPPHALQIAWP